MSQCRSSFTYFGLSAFGALCGIVSFKEKCVHHLQTNGKIVIRDGNTDLKKRHAGTKFTEFFSTKIFGFNKVSSLGLSFLSSDLIQAFALKQKLEYKEIDKSSFTSNTTYLLTKTNQFG